MNLYISNLSQDTTEQDLENAFSEFGAIKSLKIIIDRETNLSKGYGFVEMEEKGSGYDAIDYLDMSYLKGNIINVREAKNSKEGTPNNKKSFSKGPNQQRGNFQRRDSNSNRSNDRYNRQDSYGNNSSYNKDVDYNNDLSYNA